MSARYIEILEFTHFVRIFKFDGNDVDCKNKQVINKITVSVVLDLEWGDTSENIYKSE
jgi:hypothetical protein